MQKKKKNLKGRPKRKASDAFKVITLLPYGTKHSAGELARRYGVNQCTISRRLKQGKDTWTDKELREWAKMLKGGSDIRGARFVERKEKKRKRPMNINDVEYNHSAAERSMMRF